VRLLDSKLIFTMKKIVLLLCFIIISQLSNAQVTVTQNSVATDLAQTLLGTGVTLSNATLNCGAVGSGIFLTTASNLGLDSGIVLTSGSALLSAGTVASFASAGTGNGADPDLTTLIGGSTFDKCILEFDFVTVGDTVKFDYVFGSEEYQSYTCSTFNDVFGFFLSGPGIVGPFTNSAKNIALVPGSTTCPVAISTIYCPNLPQCCGTAQWCFGNTPGCGAFNAGNNTCAYFVCNGATAPGTIAYQGFTTVLTAVSEVIPCSTYHIKLAIADKGDQVLDSGVFIKAKSFSSNIISYQIETGLSSDNPYIIEGCDSAKLSIKRKIILNTPTADTVNFLITGTAQNGIDYLTLPSQITFAANFTDTIQSFDLYAIQDGLSEGTEFIKIYVLSGCAQQISDSIIIEVRDSLSFSFNNIDTAICLGNSVNVGGQVDSGITMQWTPSTFVLDPTQLNTVITPLTFGQQYYTITGTYRTCAPVVKGFMLKTDPVPVIDPMPDLELCEGRTVDINAIVNPAFPYNLTWNSLATGTPAPGLINTAGYTPTFNGTTPDNIIFTATSPNAGCAASDTFFVQVWPFAVGTISPDTLVCNGAPTQLFVTGGNNLYQWYQVGNGTLSCYTCPDPIATGLGITTYYAILLDPNGCADTLDVTVDTHPPFNLFLHNGDTTIFLGDNIQLNATGAPFYYWNPTDYLTYSQSGNPQATPLEDITYTVTGVSLLQGCPQIDSFRVKVVPQQVFVPNAFSPNGDGNNDVFKVGTIRNMVNIPEFRVFNRWGQEMFYTTDVTKGWDGNYKGVKQDSGVYHYIIRVAYANGKTQFLKGDVTLIR
jgi:gliding motility-associated-like protein